MYPPTAPVLGGDSPGALPRFASLAPPPGALVSGPYLVRFASDLDELHAVQRLRFRVFNQELHEGLASAWETGRDEDEYDLPCHHLMVISRGTGEVVGTYRMQTSEQAASYFGFYSSSEFDLSGLSAAVLDGGVEVGRACVARDHRNGRVITLLWRGLARYMSWTQRRFLFGCCSVTSQDRALGRRLLVDLTRRGALHPTRWADPLPAVSCDEPGAPELDPSPLPPLPTLFESYLKLGAKVCGGPALDARFGTIDFFLVLDVATLEAAVQRRFLASEGWESGGGR